MTPLYLPTARYAKPKVVEPRERTFCNGNLFNKLLLTSIKPSSQIGKEANIHAKDKDSQAHLVVVHGKAGAVEILVNSEANIDTKDKDNKTPLHLAAKYGYIDIVKILINKKVDIEAGDRSGQTPLHFSARYGNAGTIEVLIDKEADIHAKY